MTAENRRQKILSELKYKGELEVLELANALDVSVETVRRDLRILSSRHALKRVHGGAVINPDASFLAASPTTSKPALMAIADKVMTLLKPGDSLFLEGGPLGRLIADKLADYPGILVVSNSVEVVDAITNSAKGNDSFLLGGAYNLKFRETSGQSALQQLKEFVLDYAVVMPDAINLDHGLMKYRLPQAEVVEQMITQAGKTIALVPAAAMDRTAIAKFAEVDEIYCLVSDTELSLAWTGVLSQKGVNVLT